MKQIARSFLRLACELCGASNSRLRITAPGASKALCLLEERFGMHEREFARETGQLELLSGFLPDSLVSEIRFENEECFECFDLRKRNEQDELLLRRSVNGLEMQLVLVFDGHGNSFSNERAVRAANLLELFEKILDFRGLGNALRFESPLDAIFEPPIIAKSAAMLYVKRLLRSMAASDLTILVEGETGTGKEVIARNIHRLSERRSRPLVIVGSSEMPGTLLQSELFGHIEGAFTGASRDRAGLVESANGGTFFLDEIGELPLALQSALLRVLQEKEVRRIGESKRRKIDTRFVLATNRDLEELVKRGKFRRDLYFRISGARIFLPPLRERPEDILPLAEHFMKLCAERSGRPAPGFSSGAVRRLISYDWPGNVRELRNEIERVYALWGTERIIKPEMISPRIANSNENIVTSPSPSATIPRAIESLERSMICEALARTGGNRTKAAEALGITRQGLLKKLKRYGILK